MKYLVIQKPRRTTLPPEELAAIQQAAKEWLNAKLADGTIDCAYAFAAAGGVAIGNADSHEDLMRQIVESPLWPVSKFEVHALCDFDQAFDASIERLQKLGG